MYRVAQNKSISLCLVEGLSRQCIFVYLVSTNENKINVHFFHSKKKKSYMHNMRWIALATCVHSHTKVFGHSSLNGCWWQKAWLILLGATFKQVNYNAFKKYLLRHIQCTVVQRKNETPLFISMKIIVEKWNWYQSSWIIVYFNLML